MASVLLFSRGRGRGHAVPDAMIADALVRLNPDVTVTLASYATGAETLRAIGKDVVDLNLPEEPDIPRVMFGAAALLESASQAGTVVVSHEEFAVLPVAKMKAIRRAIFMADWLPPVTTYEARCLAYADEIIFLDWPGYYSVPAEWAHRFRHVGPIFGTARLPGHGAEIRRALGIEDSAFLVLVAPGGSTSHSEAVTPICKLVLDAWERVPLDKKHLVWVASDSESAELFKHPRAQTVLTILKPHQNFADTVAASDLLITKGNRVTTLEAEYADVPSISISYHVNRVDDHRIGFIPNNVALAAESTPPELLASHIAASAARRRLRASLRRDNVSGRAADVATRILAHF